jgi:glycosyltransferase involved in cell wall biosynthesis
MRLIYSDEMTSSNNFPSVAVIIPTFNAEATVLYALQSITAQSKQPDQVLIVDDASTDRTVELVDSFIRDHRLSSWSITPLFQNRGAGGARDYGARLACSDYLAFLDADDEWLPHALNSSLKLMVQSNLDLLGAQFENVNKRQQSLCPGRLNWITLNSLLLRNCFLTSTVVIKRSQYLNAGGFDIFQRYSEDYRFWLAVVSQVGSRCAVISDAHARYAPRSAASSPRLSRKHWSMERAELLNFWLLRCNGTISWLAWGAASAFSLLKYGFRLIRH